MIRCGGCGRLWPQETKWCGECRATLGARLCEAGHENPLDARCCLECGSPKLTRAVEGRNLRPVTWIVLVAALSIGAWLARPLLTVVGHALQWVVAGIVTYLCVGAALSVAVGGLLGPKAGKAVGALWIGTLRLAAAFVGALVRAVGGTFKPRSH